MDEPVQIRLDDDLDMTTREVGGQTGVVVHHRGLQKYFHFGPEESVALRCIDGIRSSSEIFAELQSTGVTWTQEDLSDFVTMLIQSRLAIVQAADTVSDEDGEESDAGPASPPSPTSYQRTLKSLSTVVSIRIPIMNFDSASEWLSKRIGWFFHPVSVVVWAVAVFSSWALIASRRAEFTAELSRLFDQGIWLTLIVIWALSKVWHEIGHAVSARRQNVRVGQTGVMFFLFAPLAYVDVTNAWRLPQRFSRMQIALAGVYFELGVAAIAGWAWYGLDDGMLRHLAAQVFLIAGPATLLVNANPLLRLDGYYVLSDLADIPNLRSHGRGQLGAWLERVLLGVERPKSLLCGWRRPFATLHAAASVVFQVVWMSGLVFAVSIWAHGLGVLVAVAAVLLWAVLPATTWVVRRWRSFENWGQRRRMLFAGLTIVSIGQWGLAQSSPLARRVPVIARYQGEQLARASSNAFITRVHVTTGQRVRAGDVLMELRDDELQVRRDVLVDELALAELLAVTSRQEGELADSKSASEQVDSFRRQLRELDDQLMELTVVADREGLVTTPRLESMVGRFVNEGDELIRVCDPNEKELVVSVDPDSVGAYEQAFQDQRRKSVRFRGGQVVRTQMAGLRPRASTQLPHPALAASVGGPIAIEPGEDGEVKSIQPRLQAVCVLSPVDASQLRSGQIGMMSISDDRSIGNRMWDWFQKGTQ